MPDPGSFTPGPHLAAVRGEIDKLPLDVQQSTVAAAAEGLARSLDLGTEVYRFQGQLVRELRECVATLHEMAPPEAKEADPVDDLTARRTARRAAAASQ